MNEVGIIDYGAGNIASVEKAIDYAGGIPKLVSTPEAIWQCDRIILPGVGAAGEALSHLQENNLIDVLNEKVRKKATPFLGICLGMQLLADELHEFGLHQGLGWIPGKVIHFNQLLDQPMRVPHMGWNGVEFKPCANLFSPKLAKQRYFYFAHSFTFRVNDPDMIAATTRYGMDCVAAVKSETVFATQFHPEKSQIAGDYLIQAFMQWNP